MPSLSEVLVVAGAAWSLLAAIGVCRFDDVYARLHASTKSTTLGLLLTLGGAAVVLGGGDAVKVALSGLLLLFTAPIGAHPRRSGGAPRRRALRAHGHHRRAASGRRPPRRRRRPRSLNHPLPNRYLAATQRRSADVTLPT